MINGNGTTPCEKPWFTLEPALSAVEQTRRAMQTELASGWGLWYQMSFVKVVRLPEGQVVTVRLCDIRAQTCTDKVLTGPHSAPYRLAEHAVDRSYARLFVSDGPCNVSLEFGGGENLLILVTPQPPTDHSGIGCSTHAVVVDGSTAWYRVSNISTPTTSTLVFSSPGLRTSTLHSTVVPQSSLPLPPNVRGLPHLAIPISNVSIGFSTTRAITTSAVAALINTARETELARYQVYGKLAETKSAVQAAVMWTSVYNPIEQGPLANIIRGNPFSLDQNVVNADWDYVVFNWDNAFAALMLGFDSAPLGYSALIQVVKSKSSRGYVPNWATPAHKRSWSEPPIAGRVLLELFKKYNDTWVVELLFDDLYDWNSVSFHKVENCASIRTIQSDGGSYTAVV